MKDLEVYKTIKEQTVDEIKKQLANLDNSVWIRRESLGRGRGLISGTDCSYDFLSEQDMPKSLLSTLKDNAPECAYNLYEVCVNRYQKGDYLGPHKDMDMSIKNIVVSLDNSNNGLLNNETDEFIADKKGQAVYFTGVGPIHSVPPVKDLRYVLIYLYN